MRVALLLVASVLAVAVSGCVGASDSATRVTPFTALVTAEPGRPVEVALLVENRSPFREALDVRADGLPVNWSFASEFNGSLVVNGQSSSTVVVSLTPAEGTSFGPRSVRLRVGDGAADVVVHVADLGREHARAGVGAQVLTVGFWDNGTVFYTNMKEVRDNARLHWVTLDEDARDDENMVPIKMFVGGKRGEPVPEPYNSTGYVNLIEGFDERVRTGNGGMRGGETLVARIPPEKAYTRPGNEEHRLYGEALNFVIRVVSVDVLQDNRVLPCPPGTPVCPP